MIQTLLAYVLVTIVIAAALPWAAWLLRNEPNTVGKRSIVSDDHLQRTRQCRVPTAFQFMTLTLALSIGGLTLVMLWEGILGIPFTVVGITLPYLLLMLAGFLLWWQARLHTDHESSQTPRKFVWGMRIFPLLMLIAISGAILFNAVNLPFHRDDALGIYQPQAQSMYQLRGLIPLTGTDSLYRTYPMLIQSAYTYAYLASGWENEYLANLIGALLSVGCLPVAYWLGCLLKDKRTGWMSALLLAFTPAFGRWASAGYVDLPMAFFYGLSAIFAIRLWHSGNWKDALLAGLMIGLAAWTKNAALLGVPLLGLWLLYGLLRRRINVVTAVLAVMACGVIAGPWYIRNLLGADFVVMDMSVWTVQAQRTINNLLVFLTRFENFGLTGWVVVVGVVVAVLRLIRRRGDAPEHTVALLWSLPMFAAWWWFVSYDPRFLLLFLPILCGLGGAWLIDLWERLPSGWQPAIRWALFGVAMFLALQTVWFSVEYKDEILRNPLMTDAEKREMVGRE
jgi:hypothetical protein